MDYDKWLMKQADEYWENKYYDCEEECEEEEKLEEPCGECKGCIGRRRLEYEEARAEAEYEERRLRDVS